MGGRAGSLCDYRYENIRTPFSAPQSDPLKGKGGVETEKGLDLKFWGKTIF